MSVQSYLSRLAGELIIRDAEKLRINASISTLSSRIVSYFGSNITDHFMFGSYTRGTILPRRADERSDIDYMVVFKSGLSYAPQTFLNHMRRFVNHAYSTSEVRQSHPTIVLELQHIKFEIVPAKRDWWGDMKIPSPQSGYVDWVTTDPNSFNSRLTTKNRSHGSNIKPLVRLMKYWNAKNGYIYSSYGLENSLVNRSYWFCTNLKDYLASAVDSLSYNWAAPQSTKDKVDRAKRLVMNTLNYERAGNQIAAELEIKKLLPEFS